ncbi:MAG TPA: DUF4426 domain-containing protein [Pseudomonadales bacterium]
MRKPQPARSLLSAFLAVCLLALPVPPRAEQMQRLGPFEVHYVVVQSTFFSSEIASRYAIVRGRDRALLNISVLDETGSAVPVVIAGTVTNLLGQVAPLEFREVTEGPAVYYLAEIKHTDRETLRFAATITGHDGVPRELRFQQQMFWDAE